MIFNKCRTCIVVFIVVCLESRQANGESCSRPRPVDNAYLKKEHDGQEVFEDGAKVEYRCDIGYTIQGTSRERTCSDGGWSRVRFSCLLIRCPFIENPENGRRLDANNGAGQATTFECDVGYELKGYKSLLCRVDGEWSPPEPPFCDPILCPELPRVRNGQIFQDSSDGVRNNYRSVAEFTCNSGYMVNGNKKKYFRECRADGTWTGQQPHCDIPKCEQIEDFWGGTVSYFGDRQKWSQAFFLCNDNYSPFPNDVDLSECNENLIWTPEPPKCMKKKKVHIPSNGYTRSRQDWLLHGQSYSIYCYKDYELFSGDFLYPQTIVKIVNINGTFQPDVPKCEEERCDPADLQKAIVHHLDDTRANSKVLSRTKVKLSCQQGYGYYKGDKEMKKPVIRECRKGNLRRAPTCEEEWCLLTGYQVNGDTYHRERFEDRNFVTKGQYIKSRKEIEVVCTNEKYYELYVNSTDTYVNRPFTSECRFGEFADNVEDFPICLEKRCLFSENRDACFIAENNGSCRSGDFKVHSGSSVTIRCKDGSKLYRPDGGTPGEVDEAVIECKKGEYINSYKCIPDNVFQALVDYATKMQEAVDTTIERFTCRFSIFGFTRCKDHCLVPTITDGFAKSTQFNEKVTGEVQHDTQITFECEYGYALSDVVETTCRYGEWDIVQFPNCNPKPCSQSLKEGSLLWVNSDQLSETDGVDQIFPNGSNLEIECRHGYNMVNKKTGQLVKNIRRGSTCVLGEWTHTYSCEPESCTVPDVKNASIETKASATYKHTEKIVFKCNHGHHFVEKSPEDKQIRMMSTCTLGNWSVNIPERCDPDSCNLKIMDGSEYTQVDTGDVIETRGLIDHGTGIHLTCLDDFDTFYGNGTIVTGADKPTIVTCNEGQWENIHVCKKRCEAFDVPSGRLMRDENNITTGEMIVHGETVTMICYESEEGEFSRHVTCKNGQWRGTQSCTLTSSTETSTIKMEPTPESTAETEESPIDNSDGSEDYNDANESGPEHIQGCELSLDERFVYSNEKDEDVEPGSIITIGTTLTVTCASIGFYEYYEYISNSDDGTDYYSIVPQNETLTCTVEGLTGVDLQCPEVVPVTNSEKCMTLENGKVVAEKFGIFDVSCDQGFSLNLIRPDKTLCTCSKEGELRSDVGNQVPACIPDDCVLPFDIDERLSVTNKDGVSLSGGFTVKHGDALDFNCSKVNSNEQKYEPFNRRFTCLRGQWKEQDQGWTFGNEGRFPECRQARCKPECENDGVCYRDNTCRCNDNTEGDYCEIALCDPKCQQNSGTCTAPGKCSCPIGRYGQFCQYEGCSLPKNSAPPKHQKMMYRVGEEINEFQCDRTEKASPREPMVCQGDGSWSTVVECVKFVFYLISVKTHDKYGGGTNANVYIYLHGQGGKTAKIAMRGYFETGDVDEVRREAKDVRPLTGVTIGHDGSGVWDDWLLEFASVYVEDLNEYYVFRQESPVWIKQENDVYFPSEGVSTRCITSFDEGHEWYPRWKRFGHGQEFDIGRGRKPSLRGCQQQCAQRHGCVAVFYNNDHKTCRGFTVIDQHYFKQVNYVSRVYIKKCKSY